MAELTLKTRLLNKMSESTVTDLRKGEINFYPAGDFLVMEVGGSDKPFAAKASDVAAWAKADVKPTYTATEIEGLEGFIAGEIQDSNTEYTFEESNGQLVIKHKDIADLEWEILTTIDIITPTELTTILSDYVTKTELVEELSKYVSNATFATFQEANIAAIADAKAAAEANAKAYADGVKSDLLGEGTISETYDTLKEIADWIETSGVDATDLSTALAAETKAREDADAALDARIKAYEDVAATYATKSEVEAVANAAQTANQVASAIDTKIAALDLANTYDAKGAAAAAEAAAKAYADSLEHENTTYTAGAGLKLDGTVFSIDTDTVFILDANA